jgi:SAM-dependent methyltransferase
MTMTDGDARSLEGMSIAQTVQAFYERHPYPPPVDDLDRYRDSWSDSQKRRADFHLFWPARIYREDQSVLVAGCGTAQAAKHALRWPRAQITGIDFSAASVRSTAALKHKYQLDNLRVHQLPIERIGELGMQFDQIVCTGVLHHLENPDAGLKALRDVLKPDGAMHLMVYAPYGRTGIYMLQEFCRRLDIRATDTGIRELIALLEVLPPAHPLASLLREAPDFRDEAALADALLHPQDRAYSVPQLFDFLARGNLKFGRWLKQAAYSPLCGAMAKIPQTAQMQQLPPVERYAVAELFRGTMLRHSVIAYRDDDLDLSRKINFFGNDWLNYVPIRQPETICVQERLPAGAAAVLINRSHTYTDMYLPINAAEKRLFDAIDGNRSIGSIVTGAIGGEMQAESFATARCFFECLWAYDQIVFDASKTAG